MLECINSQGDNLEKKNTLLLDEATVNTAKYSL